MNTNGSQTPMQDTGSTGIVTFNEAIALASWQEEALAQWTAGDGSAPHKGTLEIFTGGGKTLIALAAFCRITSAHPNTKLAVVVPSEALARQWVEALKTHTSLNPADVGMMGAGKSDTLAGKRALVAVLNSAAKKLPDMAFGVDSLMLVVDECHRAGAASFSKVLDTPARFRMGLSATPERDEVDDNGLPVAFDRQIVARRLGNVVYRFGLREARQIGWLPSYVVHHHGVHLDPQERLDYERISRKISDAGDRLVTSGLQTSQAWHLAARGGESAALAQAYVGALAARKDFLYRAKERGRVAAAVVEQALRRSAPPRVLVFHERVAEVEELFATLQQRLPHARIALEHSELPTGARKSALARFRSGEADVLVSVKSLVEGIDVPDADVGVSVASSSSVRQRIQTLGRVLRRKFDGEDKVAEMHVLYVHDTVDEAIYGKEDWSDLTGADANRYWLHPLDPKLPPVAQPGPPLEPRPTEEAEWIRLGEHVPEVPEIWRGVLPDLEFSVDTRGNVSTSDGAHIANPQGVAAMVGKIRGRPGGRFRISPVHNLVIVFGESDRGMVPYLAGRLDEPFRVTASDETTEMLRVDPSELRPGSTYHGASNASLGTYKLRQKRGGSIERKRGAVVQFAFTDGDDPRAANARRLIAAWQGLKLSGMTFYVNERGHAWYRENGEPRFLAEVEGGFMWPDEE